MIDRILRAWRHSDVQYVVRTSWLKFAKLAIQMISGFALVWYLGNYHSKAFLGEFQFLIALTAMLGVFGLSGMQDALVRSTARGHDYSLIRGAKLAGAISLSGSAVLVGYAAHSYWSAHDPAHAAAVLVCAAAFPFTRTLNLFECYLTGKQRFAQECVYSSLRYGLQAVVAFVAIQLWGEVLWWFLLIYLGSALIISALSFWATARSVDDKTCDPELFPFAGFMTLVGGCTLVAVTLDRVVVRYALGPESVAVYFIGMYVFSKSSALLHPFLSVLSPRFARGTMALTWKKIATLGLVGVAWAVGAFGVAVLILPLLFPNYPESVPVGMCVSLALLFTPADKMCQIYFRATRNQRAIFVPTVVARLVCIAAYIPAVHFGGLLGLAFVRAMGEALSLGLHLAFLRATKRPGTG
ncbi:MAG: hypothetical protein GY851_25925 [bacterium]|nr:hypothetical protein [bacterium]